ncbi:hypothetical protein BGZ98_006013 [Dissophora globulifera]|nr:hypothetical protein BGZ98_006013 [Dissophora globulifera]
MEGLSSSSQAKKLRSQRGQFTATQQAKTQSGTVAPPDDETQLDDDAEHDGSTETQDIMDLEDEDIPDYDDDDPDYSVTDTTESSVPDDFSVATDSYSAIGETEQNDRQLFQLKLNEAEERFRNARQDFADTKDPTFKEFAEYELEGIRRLQAQGYEQGFWKPKVVEKTVHNVPRHRSTVTAASRPDSRHNR